MNAAASTSSAEPSNSVRYDANTIALHWLTAAIIVSLWVSEQIAGWFPRPIWRFLLNLHITLGVTLVAVMALRILWRLTRGRRLPDADSGILATSTRGAHHVLYVAIVVTILLGLTLETVRADLIWGLIQLPSIAPDDKGLRRALLGYHEFAANFVLAVAALHAGAALFHHYVLRDGVLRRMLQGG